MKLIIDELTDNIRIDTYLADYMQDFSRSKIQSEIKKGSVLVNSKIVKPSYILKENDLIEFEPLVNKIEILPENIPLNIIWEDYDMLLSVIEFYYLFCDEKTFPNEINRFCIHTHFHLPLHRDP